MASSAWEKDAPAPGISLQVGALTGSVDAEPAVQYTIKKQGAAELPSARHKPKGKFKLCNIYILNANLCSESHFSFAVAFKPPVVKTVRV